MATQNSAQNNEQPKNDAQSKPPFYRVNEDEQQNWNDWWLDFGRNGE